MGFQPMERTATPIFSYDPGGVDQSRAPGNKMLFIEFRARFNQTAPCLLVDPFRVQTF
jgi:hypothetical protein